jgi:hypothetical protein
MVGKKDGSICYKTLASRFYIVLNPNTQMLMPRAKSMWGRLMKMKIFEKKYQTENDYNKIIRQRKPARQVEEAKKWG